MFKFKRFWNCDNLRELCINNHYYTCGDNDDYIYIMRFIRVHKPTDHNISLVAMDIYRHSDKESTTLEEVAENVASIVKIHVVSE